MNESTDNELDSAPQTADGENRSPEGEEQKRKRRRKRKVRRPSCEPQDEVTAKVLDFVTDVVENMGLDCRVTLRPPKDDEDRDINIDIAGPDSSHIIGKKGQTLAALQFLANRAINRPTGERRYVSVDAEGYRSRRDDSLAQMATRLGQQAIAEGKVITFEPMSPRDRRIVHMALVDIDGVVTRSDGEGDGRRVQIIPVRAD